MRYTIFLPLCLLTIFINPIYSGIKEERSYSSLYLYPMELSEEVKASIEEFLRCNTKIVDNNHYLEISIFEEKQDPIQVYYEINIINSPNKEQLVIEEETLSRSWYKGVQPLFIYVGYSYYNKHWIIVRKWYKLQELCNPFVKRSSYLFVKDFLLWKHEIQIVGPGNSGYGLRFKIRENQIIKLPPIKEE